MKVKICCISSVAEAVRARAAGADYLGFVGPMPSGPGTLTVEEIAPIIEVQPVDGRAHPVHLSAAADAEGLAAASRATGAKILQIVRHVPVAVHRALARRCPDITRWQVIHVEGPETLERIAMYQDHVDAFLLDSGAPSRGRLGGTGTIHDWALSRACVEATARPVFLAGGLTPDNIARAIRTVRPHGVDICTGVRSDGILDAEKLSRFCAAVAEAGAE